jgi:hypothetical protein
MDNLHKSELNTVKVISRQTRIFWNAGQSEPSNIEACMTSREIYLHSTLAVPRNQVVIGNGFRKPAPLPPRRGDGSTVIVVDLDAHKTWLGLPVSALQHFPGHGEPV